MTIDVVVTVPDGIAVSVDTLATNFVSTDSQPEAPPKVFELIIDKKSYAVCVAGQGEINHEPMCSIFKSLEKSFKIVNPTFDEITNHFVSGLLKKLQEKFKREDIENADYRLISFLFCGFENNDPSKPIVQEHLVFSGIHDDEGSENKSGHIIRTTNEGTNIFSAFAIGIKKDIKHFVSGRDAMPPENPENFRLVCN